MSEYFSIAYTLHCVHHDKWIFISQMRVLTTQKVYDIWYIDVDFAIIKFIDETVFIYKRTQTVIVCIGIRVN